MSYVQRIEVERRTTSFNKKLVVAIQNGKYVLNADHANYSFASLHRVFQKAINLVDLRNESRVLVLGCGAGSIPSILQNEKGLAPVIDAVEIDPVVIDLGKKYFDLGSYANLNITIADAFEYVKDSVKSYDLICVDVFDGLHVPERFLSSLFIENCSKLLTENGELLFNFVAHNHETKAQVAEIEKMMKHHFSDTTTHSVEGINRIFWAKK